MNKIVSLYCQTSKFLVVFVFLLTNACQNSKPSPKECDFDNLTNAISNNDLDVFKNCARIDFDIYQTNEKNESLLVIARKEGKGEKHFCPNPQSQTVP